MAENSFHYGQPRLENDLIALEPFDPKRHTTLFVETLNSTSDFIKYIDFPAITTDEEFIRDFWDPYYASSTTNCLYAIHSKLQAESIEGDQPVYAGLIGLSQTNPTNAVSEIGIMTFPAYQRTHISPNAIGLILCWAMDSPSMGGLGLRRIEWNCNSENAASKRMAERMEFVFEGIARWHKVFPQAAVGAKEEALEQRNGTTGEQKGRHTAMYSIVWDEWDGEKREAVLEKMKLREKK